MDAVTTSSSCVLVTAPQTCLNRPLHDPDFEFNDGSWTFNGGQIIDSTPSTPSRSGSRLARFLLPVSVSGVKYVSFSQTLNSFCEYSNYLISGHFAVPFIPPGVWCNIFILVNAGNVLSVPISSAQPDYTPFSTFYRPMGPTIDLSIGAECLYDVGQDDVLTFYFDDMDVVNQQPPPASSTCSSTVASTTATETSAPDPTCSPVPLGAVCGVPSAINEIQSIETVVSGVGVTSAQACVQSCVSYPRCGFVEYDGEVCMLFEGTVTESTYRDPNSRFLAYDNFCLFPVCSSITSSTSSASFTDIVISSTVSPTLSESPTTSIRSTPSSPSLSQPLSSPTPSTPPLPRPLLTLFFETV